LQGPKNNKCTFHHRIKDEISGTIETRKGNIIKHECNVKFHFFLPVFDDGKLSVNAVAIISYGEHTHPPPPPRKVLPSVKTKLLEMIKSHDCADATARRLVASPILSIMLDGDLKLTNHHVRLALNNQDVVNHLIRKERTKEYPWGTSFQGAEYMMNSQSGDEYIRKCEAFADGHFIVHCQSREQSRLLLHSSELHIDKTFSRTKCRELEFNAYDPVAKSITTFARIFTDYEDELGYYHAFRLIFDQAERDTGKAIPWGHLVKKIEDSPTKTRLKAILVDQHGGQIKGLAKYFHEKFPLDGDNGERHILSIVKTCYVHFIRSINKLIKQGVDKGTSYINEHTD
jgi:hypothetical protein